MEGRKVAQWPMQLIEAELPNDEIHRRGYVLIEVSRPRIMKGILIEPVHAILAARLPTLSVHSTCKQSPPRQLQSPAQVINRVCFHRDTLSRGDQ